MLSVLVCLRTMGNWLNSIIKVALYVCAYTVGEQVWLKAHYLSHAGLGVTAKPSRRWRRAFVIGKFLTLVTVRLVGPVNPAHIARAHLSQITRSHA
jgi:hypothetical protein